MLDPLNGQLQNTQSTQNFAVRRASEDSTALQKNKDALGQFARDMGLQKQQAAESLPEETLQVNSEGKVLHWKKNERMGGMIPVWEYPDAQEKIAGNLENAGEDGAVLESEDALSYAPQNKALAKDEEFGFADLIDMVNPLQHLPVVGYLYREITGDEIKPISRIIGGAAYGGVGGAAMGLAETVIEYETGTSIAGNVAALVTEGRAPRYRSDFADEPEKRLNQAVRDLDQAEELPESAMGFTEPVKREATENQTYYARAADGRTAGTMPQAHRRTMAEPAFFAEPRKAITELTMSPLPAMTSAARMSADTLRILQENDSGAL